MHKQITRFLLLCLISIISIFLHGYTFSSSDQTHYVPLVLKKAYPNLYPHDYVSDFPEGKLTFFIPLMSSLVLGGTDMEWAYLFFYVTVHIIIIYQLFYLSLNLTGSSAIAYAATIFLSTPRYVAGTTLTTLDIAWLPRYIAYALLLLFLNALVNNRYLTASVFLGIAGLLHPFTGIITLCMYAGYIIIDKNKRVHITPVVIASTPLAWFTIVRLFESPPTLTMSFTWLQIITTRMSYNFLLKWQLSAWFALLFAVIVAIIHTATTPTSKLHHWLKITLVTAAIVSLIHFIGAELFQLTAVAQLQLLRIWLFPTLLSYIALAAWVTKLWEKSSLGKILAIIMFTAIFTNFGRGKALGSIEWPHTQDRDWDQVQKWAQANTPINSLFITPPQRVGFRVLSHRSTVTEIKDGSSGLYSYNFAKIWQERMADLHPLGNKTSEEMIILADKYQADYFVTFTSDHPHPRLLEVFRTPTLVVYKL